jgi:hypothetical protein
VPGRRADLLASLSFPQVKVLRSVRLIRVATVADLDRTLNGCTG